METETRIDRSDSKRALVVHAPDGERYIVEYCSLWNRGDDCVGTRIVAATGPIHYRDLGNDGGPIQATPELFDLIDHYLIDHYPGLEATDAEWLQAEEDAGRLAYPIGAR